MYIFMKIIFKTILFKSIYMMFTFSKLNDLKVIYDLYFQCLT
jgi:hypothetical protein